MKSNYSDYPHTTSFIVFQLPRSTPELQKRYLRRAPGTLFAQYETASRAVQPQPKRSRRSALATELCSVLTAKQGPALRVAPRFRSEQLVFSAHHLPRPMSFLTTQYERFSSIPNIRSLPPIRYVRCCTVKKTKQRQTYPTFGKSISCRKRFGI